MDTPTLEAAHSEDSDCGLMRKKAKKNFFKHFLTPSVTPVETNEVELFLADQSTKLKSLHKYPSVKAVFMKYNAALPSSASVERLFSLAGRMFTALRSQLSDKNFERMLFLKANKHVISD